MTTKFWGGCCWSEDYLWLTMKFCCSGDHEYITGTEATALSVFRGMTCRGNSKPLSTVHCTGRRQLSSHNLNHVTVLSRDSSPPTSRVPLREPTDVMMCTGWIRLVFHSWFRMSVRSMIFCRLVLNMLCRKATKRINIFRRHAFRCTIQFGSPTNQP